MRADIYKAIKMIFARVTRTLMFVVTPKTAIGLQDNGRAALILVTLITMTMQTAWAEVEINKTNFPDEKFRSWLLHQEYGTDGMLTDTEIAEITYISVSNKGIQSLKGIEFFTALTSMWCDKNNLTTLDISKNTALTWLVCSDNQLTILELSNNTMLYSIFCSNNQLATLNVTQNPSLTQLDCSGNQLTFLDVSQNTTLTNLNCDHNLLTMLDVSHNTSLTWLVCSDNQLTNLDMSKNTELEYLYCDNNLLTMLDMSKNTKLTQLHCYRNQIRGTKMDAMVESLPYNMTISHLYVIHKDNEQNVMTTMQVAVAKDRGWTPIYYDGNSWQEYAGSDPSCIKVIDNEKLMENEEDAWFKLDGYRLSDRPSQRSVYVNKGRKIIIK